MVETTMRWVIDVREKDEGEPAEEAPSGLSLGEVLYRALFGDDRMEPAQLA